MGLFNFFKGPDINQGVKEYRESKGGIASYIEKEER